MKERKKYARPCLRCYTLDLQLMDTPFKASLNRRKNYEAADMIDQSFERDDYDNGDMIDHRYNRNGYDNGSTDDWDF